MSAALHIKTRVLPGHKIEIASPDLPEGELVEVTVTAAERPRPIWETAAEIGAAVPDEAWATLPPDASRQVDHYLYGAPKERE